MHIETHQRRMHQNKPTTFSSFLFLEAEPTNLCEKAEWFKFLY